MDLTIGVVRPLTKDDLWQLKERLNNESDSLPGYVTKAASLGWEVGKIEIDPVAVRLFDHVQQFLDLILEPESAESAIANFDELYRRLLATNPRHAKRWLIAQVGWLVFRRAMELLRMFSAARAGK